MKHLKLHFLHKSCSRNKVYHHYCFYFKWKRFILIAACVRFNLSLQMKMLKWFLSLVVLVVDGLNAQLWKKMINCLNIQQQNTDMFVSSQQWKQNTVLIEGFIIKDLLLARHRLVLVVNKKAADKHFSSEFMMLNCVYITTRCSPRLLCIKHWTLSQPLTSHILMWRLLFFSVSVQSCFSQLVFRFFHHSFLTDGC